LAPNKPIPEYLVDKNASLFVKGDSSWWVFMSYFLHLYNMTNFLLIILFPGIFQIWRKLLLPTWKILQSWCLV
jgi:hypothetical protein